VSHVRNVTGLYYAGASGGPSSLLRSLVWLRFFPLYQPKRFVWIEMEIVS
jgi:hypothetical protein